MKKRNNRKMSEKKCYVTFLSGELTFEIQGVYINENDAKKFCENGNKDRSMLTPYKFFYCQRDLYDEKNG
jgi:hypothetical protein